MHTNDEQDRIAYYLLDTHTGEIVQVADDGSNRPLVVQWATQLTDEMRRVAEDHVRGLWISTVFLGLDESHAWPRRAGHRPLVFECCVFRDDDKSITGRSQLWLRRDCTRVEALASHAEALHRVHRCEFDQAERGQ